MPQILSQTAWDTSLANSPAATFDREHTRALIEETGIIPSIRTTSAEDGLYVAQSLTQAGIPLIEIAANMPNAVDVISHVSKHAPNTVIGAGSVTSLAMARHCVDAGARFLTSEAFLLEVIEFAASEKMAILPGAFTPTEVVAAWNAGSDFVKIVPCTAGGGAAYIRSLKAAMPDVALMAAGGITQQNALDLVAAGATGLGIGTNLIPAEAVRLRQTARIQELARRFLSLVDAGRIEAAGRSVAGVR